MLGRGPPPIPNKAVGVHVGAVRPLLPSGLRGIGPSTLLMLGRGSPPIPNKAVGVHVGAVRPLPPSDLKELGL